MPSGRHVTVFSVSMLTVGVSSVRGISPSKQEDSEGKYDMGGLYTHAKIVVSIKYVLQDN